LEDSEGNIWISTLRGVAQITSVRLSSLKTEESLPDKEVSTISRLDSSRILIGNNLGINILQEDQWAVKTETYTVPISSANRIMAATQIAPGVAAIAGSSKGLGILDKNNTIKWHKIPGGLNATSVVADKDKLFVGT